MDNPDRLCKNRLKHFLYMGLEGNCYTPGKRNFVPTYIHCLNSLIADRKGPDVIKEVLRYSKGRPYSICPDALLYALAVCAKSREHPLKSLAYETVEEICTTPEKMFTFTRYVTEVGKPTFGSHQKKFIDRWYNGREEDQLATFVTQVITRHRWRHKDVIHLSHVKPKTPGVAVILAYLVKGIDAAKREAEKNDSSEDAEHILTYLKAVDEVKHSDDEHVVSRLIELHNLAFEHVPSIMLKSREIWTCLVQRMPLPQLLHQLPRLYKLNLLKPNSPVSKHLLERLSSEDVLEEHPIGPIEMLMVIKHCEETNRLASPPKAVGIPHPRHRRSQLEEAFKFLFFSTFKLLPATKNRVLLALDVRNTMSHSKIAGTTNFSPADATAVLLMSFARAESQGLQALAFSTQGLVNFEINNKMTLGDVQKRMRETPMGPVNVAAPLQWALENKRPFDLIIVCTDNQIQVGDLHPAEALKEYRKEMNLPAAKLVICAMTNAGFSLSPPEEFGMLDVAGFDKNVLTLIQDFAMELF